MSFSLIQLCPLSSLTKENIRVMPFPFIISHSENSVLLKTKIILFVLKTVSTTGEGFMQAYSLPSKMFFATIFSGSQLKPLFTLLLQTILII